jgi:hypothetical protein
MKKIILILSITFTGLTQIFADDHIEITGMVAMQCQIEEGKDMNDVMKVLDEWSEYGDENFSEPFSALDSNSCIYVYF